MKFLIIVLFCIPVKCPSPSSTEGTTKKTSATDTTETSAPTGTTTTTPTGTTVKTSTIDRGTEKPTSSQSTGTTEATGDDSCEYFDIDPPEQIPVMPSKEATVVCKCSRSAENRTVTCPEMDTKAVEKIKIRRGTKQDNTTCEQTWNITARKEKFMNRRMQIKITCAVTGNEKQTLLTFEKRGNGDECQEDMDCWSSDQVCKDKKCSCFQDRTSYIRILDKCLPDAGYDQQCLFDEQCMTRDPNTLCEKEICKCRENFWTINSTDVTCITSDAAEMWPSSHPAVLTTQILSLALLYRCSDF